SGDAPAGAVVEVVDDLGVVVVVDELDCARGVVEPGRSGGVEVERDGLGGRAVAEAPVDRVFGGDEGGDRLAPLGGVGQLVAHHAAEVALAGVGGQHAHGAH